MIVPALTYNNFASPSLPKQRNPPCACKTNKYSLEMPQMAVPFMLNETAELLSTVKLILVLFMALAFRFL